MRSAVVVSLVLDEPGTGVVATAIEVEPKRWRRYPISQVSVSADFHEAADWLKARGGDGRFEMGGLRLFDSERRALVLVDAAHRLYARPFAEALWLSKARRQWHTPMRAVVAVEADLVMPQPDGWRTKIGRGSLIGALSHAVRTRLIEFRKSEAGLVREWEAYNRGVVAGDRAVPPMVQALALAAWGAGDEWGRLRVEGRD